VWLYLVIKNLHLCLLDNKSNFWGADHLTIALFDRGFFMGVFDDISGNSLYIRELNSILLSTILIDRFGQLMYDRELKLLENNEVL
ncbi:hypothetical protein QP017_05930, partial [Gallibacterium anatis]|uniref:hypothetical protein n=1 Tax=Gallibacterium anatis TaxID=750 RepID=UPI002549C237